jgi:hypothetical protein
MIINKSCAFQLPHAGQMQKNIFAFKKIAKVSQSLCCFLELLHEIANYRSADLRPEKEAPSTDEPLGFITKIFFSGYFMAIILSSIEA